MSPILRSLALLGACSVWSACSEQPAAEPVRPSVKSAPSAVVTRDSLEKKAVLPDLAATAQDRPRSILDAPVSAQPATSVASKPLDQLDQAAAAASDKEPTSFDREPGADEVTIDRFVLATGVEQREPVGESDTFSTDTDKIFAFVQLANKEGAPYALTVHWEKVDGPTSPYGFKLEVPTAARFRTWSFTRIKREPGRYRAVLRTLGGDEVASREFEIKAAAND